MTDQLNDILTAYALSDPEPPPRAPIVLQKPRGIATAVTVDGALANALVAGAGR